MKVAELEGRALDWAVAKAQGWVNYHEDSVEQGAVWYTQPEQAPYGHYTMVRYYKPSTDGVQGICLIDKYRITLQPVADGWVAGMSDSKHPATSAWTAKGRGHTPLIAAMRCLVASVYGEDIDIPKELE